MALARLLLSATTASAYVYGDGVRLRARTRLRGAETAWTDCRQAASPRFRVKSDRALRGVPLPEAGAPLDAVELALAAGAAATPWLPLMEHGRNLTSVDLMLTHDGSQIVSIDARARYGEVDRKQARRDEKRRRRDGNSDIDRVAPVAFLPAVRIRYTWRGDASFRDAAAVRTLVLWGGVVTCIALVYVTLRGGSFDELEDHEAGSDSDDDGKVGVVRGNGAVRRRR